MGITLSTQEVAEVIGTSGTAVLTTLRKDGRPASLPVWYVAFDGALHFRSPTRTFRVRHLRRDPRVSVLLHDGEHWSRLRGILIHGDAEFLEDPALRRRVADAFDAEFADLRVPAAQLPRAVTAHYAEEAIFRVSIPARPTTWDNTKIRLNP
ncbi:pyridoxamine 5'-phosphate oxidase family protein [Nakamurella lactea]|uniref:pyridoxamine 5'-phosphate oxidase family protein n=1 Tax=Nakamurella lactea TaxID=459515 RepID=UPI00040FAED4|nr:pyridoxamine 5'-phosphate oxidase family protein [Nakamurella lactea]